MKIHLAPGAGRRAEGRLWRPSYKGAEGVADGAPRRALYQWGPALPSQPAVDGAGRCRGQAGTFSREACEVGGRLSPNGVLLVCPKWEEPERAAQGTEPVQIGGRSKGLLLVKLCREEDGFQRPEVGASLEEKEGHPALSWREGGKRSYCSCSDWR